MEILILTAFLTISLFGIIYCVLQIVKNTRLLKRNEKVCDYRTRILRRSMSEYESLPSYDEMLYSSKPLEDIYWINK